MQLREINQHHIPAFISIMALFTADSLSYYLAYFITESMGLQNVQMPYPWRVYFAIIFLIYLFKRYNPSPRISRGKDLKIIIQSVYLAGIIYTFFKILTKEISIDQSQYNLILLHLFLFIDIPLRFSVRSVQHIFLAWGIGGRFTIILGAGEDAQQLADEIDRKKSHGFKLVGYFNESRSSQMDRYCIYLGLPNDINKYVQTHEVHEMIIALETHEHEELLKIMGTYELLNICIKIIPDMYEAITGQVRIDALNGLPLLDINPDITTGFQSVLKRFLDICLGLIFIAILFPVVLIIALFIVLGSPGAIFYKQVRTGKDGIRFNVYKFRTMYEKSEEVTGPIWAEKEDPRITIQGKFLRRYHLDEIPQLYNVLRGQMSFVGPRPERPLIIEKLNDKIPFYLRRLKVKPGITGWAQIMGVYDASMSDVDEKLKHDFYYIENMSIILDIKILLMTILAVIQGGGR